MPSVPGKSVYVETLGCSKNRVDSEIMLSQLLLNGHTLVEEASAAEVILVNTCGFLTSASEESIERILELSDHKAEGRCEKLVATGCLTQRYQSEIVKEIPELDGVMGSHGFERIGELITAMYEHPEVPQVMVAPKPHYAQYEAQE
jgi:ribosomal protein S12 methylthiotransferase